MTTYNDLEDYLETLATDMGLHLVVVTDWLDILDLQLDQQRYPALVVEFPDVEIVDDGGLALDFEFNFSIIQNVPREETPAFCKNVLNTTLEKAIRFRERIYCDSEEDDLIHDAELGTTLQRITKATADNCYGWRGAAAIKFHTLID